ncbi:L,D-transpeptidase [Alteribacter keqinensis]|uniref:L,D-transpeptidase n=1 Tax=Alteribacter keqinensis TaxID=2483800 RepID=A0A3M7TTP0_9BACI|nr:L,D-transpeptidase [Alteribacter keqinensis]RNA69010.1 L,D-transpeptidase [Alteribacter keqinensis]
MINVVLACLLIVSPVWPLGENPLPGDPYVVVNKERHELAYISEGEIKSIFPVAIGKEGDDTPEGEFNLLVKAENPYYRKKDIPGGSENNPLGTRWLGFDALNTDGRIYGIHGTNNPESIGRAITAGCIRMNNEDVEFLFQEVPVGMKILVINDSRTFEEIGIDYGAIE